jgi:hypothetical protein
MRAQVFDPRGQRRGRRNVNRRGVVNVVNDNVAALREDRRRRGVRGKERARGVERALQSRGGVDGVIIRSLLSASSSSLGPTTPAAAAMSSGVAVDAPRYASALTCRSITLTCPSVDRSFSFSSARRRLRSAARRPSQNAFLRASSSDNGEDGRSHSHSRAPKPNPDSESVTSEAPRDRGSRSRFPADDGRGLGSFHTSERRGGVQRRQVALKGAEVCRD